MGEQGRRVAERLRKVGAQGVTYGFGTRPAFEPGGDGRGEVADGALGEEQAGVAALERAEEGGGRAVAFEVGGLGFGERGFGLCGLGCW